MKNWYIVQTFSGFEQKVAEKLKDVIKTKELSAQILADNCGQSFEKVMKDFNRDYWMNAEESLEYGIVDQQYSK